MSFNDFSKSQKEQKKNSAPEPQPTNQNRPLEQQAKPQDKSPHTK